MAATADNQDLIPVTILTGFLGAGKTTLLNRILHEQHGEKIAVIENEFGETGIDNEILVEDKQEQIVEMNNGCVCCTVRGDLVRILGDLGKKRRKGQLKFDRVIIETTGLANPGPVAQTFFMDEAIHNLLDIRGFNLNAVLELDPQFLTSDYHEHDDEVTSFVWKDPRPLHMEKIETFLSLMVQNYGEDLLRYKGVLNVQGEPRRMIFQGVHMLMGGTPGKEWGPGEARESVMVFIGRKLPRRLFEEGLAYCVA